MVYFKKGTGSTTRGYECVDDAFEISGYLPSDDVPILCGENTGQHGNHYNAL